MSGRNRVVAVFGAAGHTGRFVVTELLRRGFTPVAVARDAAKLAAAGFADRGVATRAASVDDPAALGRAFGGAVAVVNCAGPFLDTAEAVATAALRAGAHYLDVTAEQPSARAILERFDDAARRAGRVVMPAVGFYGGLADLLATAAVGDWDSADAVRVGIALDSWHPTAGTRITGARNTARRLIVSDGALVPLPLPAQETAWDFPDPFGHQEMIELPFSEVVLIASHLRVSDLRTHLNAAPLHDLHDPATPPPVAADDAGRSAQVFMVDVRARRGGATRRITARGRDIYAFTAPLVCEAVERLVDGRFAGRGAMAPGAAFDAPALLEALAPAGLALDVAATDRPPGRPPA